MIRVVFGGNGFDTFSPKEFTDSYVKFVIVPASVDVAALAQPLTLDSFAELPHEQRPTVRTYTVRRADVEQRELTRRHLPRVHPSPPVLPTILAQPHGVGNHPQ